MLYHKNRNSKLVGEHSNQQDYYTAIAHIRERKTNQVDFLNLGRISYSNRTRIEEILGDTMRECYFIKDYYKNLF